MGEVYRADDLKLGQAVALKFLPKALSEDPVRRERFFAEVRITRQVSHPNICRVYDIAEFEGQHFLSMEFIDGEDLASLIRRIGHLTNEKTLDIARQIQAGTASASVHVGDRAILGIQVVDATAAGQSGARVDAVSSGSPADHAGIRSNAVITSIDKTAISSVDDIGNALFSHSPGDSVEVTWKEADGTSHTATVELAVGPPA